MKRAILKLKKKPSLVLIDGNKLPIIKNYNLKLVTSEAYKIINIPDITPLFYGIPIAEECGEKQSWCFVYHKDGKEMARFTSDELLPLESVEEVSAFLIAGIIKCLSK